MEQKFGSDVHGLGAPPSQAPPPAKPRKSIKDKLIATKDRMAASLSTLASGPPQERPQSLGAKLATVGRRVTQVALEKMGRAEASDDSEFEACKVMLADLKTYHTSLKLHLQEYLNSVGALSAACLTVGADFQGLMAGADPALDTPLTNFSQVATAINNESRRIMDTAFVESVLDPIVDRLTEIEELERRCLMRERYKLDYDSYNRTVKSLREKSGVDAAKLSRKEAKLADSEALLEAFSEELFTAIRVMHENRPALILPQLRQFQAIQRDFFTAVTRKVTSLPDFPEPPKIKAVASVSRATAVGAGISTVKSPVGTGSSSGVCVVRVLHNYVPRGDDELELKTGQLVKVSRKEEDGWWFGETDDGISGMFPSNFVQELSSTI